MCVCFSFTLFFMNAQKVRCRMLARRISWTCWRCVYKSQNSAIYNGRKYTANPNKAARTRKPLIGCRITSYRKELDLFLQKAIRTPTNRSSYIFLRRANFLRWEHRRPGLKKTCYTYLRNVRSVIGRLNAYGRQTAQI